MEYAITSCTAAEILNCGGVSMVIRSPVLFFPALYGVSYGPLRHVGAEAGAVKHLLAVGAGDEQVVLRGLQHVRQH